MLASLTTEKFDRWKYLFHRDQPIYVFFFVMHMDRFCCRKKSFPGRPQSARDGLAVVGDVVAKFSVVLPWRGERPCIQLLGGCRDRAVLTVCLCSSLYYIYSVSPTQTTQVKRYSIKPRSPPLHSLDVGSYACVPCACRDVAVFRKDDEGIWHEYICFTGVRGVLTIFPFSPCQPTHVYLVRHTHE